MSMRKPENQAGPGRRWRGALLLLAVVGLAGAGLLAATSAQKKKTPQFDAKKSFAHLTAQCDFGPRPVGSAAHEKCLEYLIQTLRPLADSVEKQQFRVKLGSKSPLQTNVIARWKGNGKGEPRLLCAHWDTRPTADQEFTPANRRKPIIGANDGASGVAVLLELARMFKQSPPPRPVMIVLFDGEDYGPGSDRMYLGAKHFANNLPRDVPRRGVLIDMVGDRDLQIPQELHSRQRAPKVMREIYGLAQKRGYGRHFPVRPGIAVEDDHLPLLDKGLKVIDLIDFTYAPWHTLGDTPDKCSPASLKVVGDVLWDWVTAAR